MNEDTFHGKWRADQPGATKRMSPRSKQETPMTRVSQRDVDDNATWAGVTLVSPTAPQPPWYQSSGPPASGGAATKGIIRVGDLARRWSTFRCSPHVV